MHTAKLKERYLLMALHLRSELCNYDRPSCKTDGSRYQRVSPDLYDEISNAARRVRYSKFLSTKG